MVGKMILFALICFCAYWAVKLYKNRPQEKPDYSKGAADVSSSKVDELIKEFNDKIADIESRSAEEIKRSQETLDFYKSELEKLNKLKNK